VKKEQEFYESGLEFRFTIKGEEAQWEIAFTLKPGENFAKKFGAEVNKTFAGEAKKLAKGIEDWDERSNRIKSFFADLDVQMTFTHRHYIEDFEYIPYGEDIEEFLKREIGKPIIRWKDSDQPGYEILPNKYFYRYEPPKPADEVLKEFWKLEAEATEMLKGIGGQL
jgi:type I restriction enzyme M protein